MKVLVDVETKVKKIVDHVIDHIVGATVVVQAFVDYFREKQPDQLVIVDGPVLSARREFLFESLIIHFRSNPRLPGAIVVTYSIGLGGRRLYVLSEKS